MRCPVFGTPWHHGVEESGDNRAVMFQHGTSVSTPNLMVIDPMIEVQHSLMANYQNAGHFSSSTPALNAPYLQV